MDQCGVKQPLAKQVEHAVDLGPCGGREGSWLGAGLVGAGQWGGGGGSLVGHFGLSRLLDQREHAVHLHMLNASQSCAIHLECISKYNSAFSKIDYCVLNVFSCVECHHCMILYCMTL